LKPYENDEVPLMTICYLCTCANALAQQLNFEELKASIESIDGISDVKIIDDLCHRTGEVAESAVICACSQNYLYPLFHSRDQQPAFVDLAFLGACNAKQEEKEAAALALISGAVEKLKSSTPVPKLKVPLAEKCLVIGGGISGLTVAHHLSKFGFGVTLVSDQPVKDSDFAQMVPNYKEANQELASLDKNVQKTCEVIENARGAKLQGQIGSFILSTGDNKQIHAPLVVFAGDYEELPHQELEDPRIVTWKNYREMNTPKHAAIIICQCYGSREDATRPYCSAYCCETAIIEGKSLKETWNNDVTIIHQDIRTLGTAELAYRDARMSGVKFVRGSLATIESEEGDSLSISAENTLTQTLEEFQADYVVLSSAVLPPSFSMDLAESIGLSKDPKTGFLNPLYSKLRKESTTIPGVYITESLLAPATYEDLVDSAKATAFRVAKNILIGYEKTHPRAVVNKELCTGCETCYRLCPAKAIRMRHIEEEDKIIAHVDDVACLGCGICSSACPTRAIEVENYRKGDSLRAIEIISKKFYELQKKQPILLIQCKECALASSDLAQMADWKPKLVLPIVVPCAGHISLLEIMKAFQAGAGGLVISSCTHCHNGPGDDIAEAFADVGSQILDILGQDGERIKHLRTCAAEADKLAIAIQDLSEKLGR
jgi:heterodisulfide reductase subunit A-like polyferredoxin/coenzyme F420-reducing hydrogenase delta subunit